jgi:hypothetical protein
MKLKNILISILLVLTSTFNNLNSQTWEYNVSEKRLKGYQLLSFEVQNDKIVMFRTTEGNSFFLESINQNGLTSIELDDYINPVKYGSDRNKCKIDFEGKIYFFLDDLWEYSNNFLKPLRIFKDLDTNWRKIVDIEFDNKGNIWIAAEYNVLLYQNGPDKMVKGYAELFKYNSNGLERVKFDSIASDGNYEFFGYQYMDRADDGTIFLSIKRGKDNLMIIENEEITYRTLKGISESPERNVTDFQIKNKNDFYVTYKNFHFLDKGGEPIRFGGISHYKYGVWKHFDGDDGLPIHPYAWPPEDVKSPDDVFSVCLDNEGNHYFATVGAILKITNDDEIVVYDGKEIVKNSLMYGVEHFTNSYKDYMEPIFTNIAKVNNKLYATVMYGILEIDEETLSVNKKANKQLKVFPNPIVNDDAVIELPDNEIINSISLIDLSGAKIDADYNLNSSNIELNCSKLSNGTYIVLTRTNKDLYFSKLIVKRN